MTTRLQVSTDVAAIGIWDRGQPTADSGRMPTLQELARRGDAVIVTLEGDCAGAVDLFIDEDIPSALMAESVSIADDRTVVIRSGEVVVDGIEYFGTNKGTSPHPSSACRLPSGIYRTTVRLTRNEDELPEPAAEKEIRRAAGPREVDYYDRMNRNGLVIGLTTLLLLPVLLFFVRWYVAVPVTLGVFLGYFHVQQWLLRRNRRYSKVAEIVVPLRLAGERPILVVQLRRCAG